ncbi:MAG: lytic transglycosylase domain-containing protein [Acidobacteriota bacterium]|nr:lytic transglycosylase domain-containing protein [Acidobacteriota bacterium]MDH3529402.1 lytic transglycosylase domain-containing protein [Acidobacteriota bacterium]
MSVAEGQGLNASYSSSGKKLTMGSSKSMKGFSTGDIVIDSYIVESSRRYDIDPLLIYSQMHQESAFKKRARSHKGASGLMQLMPATARRFGVTNIYDPKQNIDAGVKYMRWLLDTFNGDVVLALAGYNAGEGAVMKYGWQVPPYRETRDYVAKISRKYNAISDPSYVQNMKSMNSTAGKNKTPTKKEVTPEPVYELDIMAVRLPNGRMRLVTN